VNGGTRHPADSTRDRGFTLVEILIAIVLVSTLSAVAVVGVNSLSKNGGLAACTASADAVKAATLAHYTNAGAYPATITAMVSAGELTLPTGVVLDTAGLTARGSNWLLTMTPGSTPGSAPSYACTSGSAGATTTLAATTTITPTTTIAPTTTVAAIATTSTTVAATTTVATTIDPNSKAVRVCVTNPAGAAVSDVAITYYNAGWKPSATSGTATCIDTSVPSATSTMGVDFRGVHAQISWAFGKAGSGTTRFDFVIAPRFVRILDTNGKGVAGVDARYYSTLGWQTFGTTDDNGCASIALPAGGIFFGATHRGVSVQQQVDLSKLPSDTCDTGYVFPIAPRFVRVVDVNGDPVAGADARYYSALGWQTYGTTDKNGCASTELLAGSIYLGAVHRGVAVQHQIDLAKFPSDTCENGDVFKTAPRFVRVVDSNGDGVAGADARYYSALGWQTYGTTDKNGCASTELLAGGIYLSAVHRGVTVQHQIDLAKFPSDSCESGDLFTTAPRFVRVVDGNGVGVAGIETRFNGNSWLALGTTGKDGCASTELLGAATYFGITVKNVSSQLKFDTSTTPLATCDTAATFKV
jgi:prepilin-type N-terminal cleavage/methylation domain-containing protein